MRQFLQDQGTTMQAYLVVRQGGADAGIGGIGSIPKGCGGFPIALRSAFGAVPTGTNLLGVPCAPEKTPRNAGWR